MIKYVNMILKVKSFVGGPMNGVRLSMEDKEFTCWDEYRSYDGFRFQRIVGNVKIKGVIMHYISDNKTKIELIAAADELISEYLSIKE